MLCPVRLAALRAALGSLLRTCGCTDIASGLFVRNGCNPGCLEDEWPGDQGLLLCVPRQSRNETCPNEAAAKVFSALGPQVTWRRWWRGFYESKKNAWHLDNPMMQFAQSTEARSTSPPCRHGILGV